MRKSITTLAIAIIGIFPGTPPLGAQQSQTVPQTARQALMEMFLSKTPGSFVKHLPMATRTALEKSGALTSLQQYTLLGTQLQSQQSVQTFETGSVILSSEDPKTAQKIEITVENDALHGDDDDLALSFQVYKNGELQRTPFMPQMTFSMRKEAQFWTLNEISLTIHVPLADPDLLKAVTEKMQPATGTAATLAPHPEVPSQPSGSDAMVIAAMRTIVTAEASYASTYPTVGYTCTLSSLDGFGGGQPNERQAMLINSGLASGKKYGFIFTLSDCNGSSGFRLTAVPNGNTFARKTFCADQAGVVRSSDDGNAASCLAVGTPVR